jgi:protocatechuate 3,4-dioxygenase beta subunit
VSLSVSIKRGEHSWGLSGVETPTDETGQFLFRNVNPSPAGTCSVRVIGRAGYRPAQQEITDLTAPVVVRLEKGLRLTGTVIDDDSGLPVPDAEVYALWTGTVDGRFTSEVLEADDKTDAQGRFSFTNMAKREYRINVRGANPVNPRQEVLATGGQSEPIVLRIRIPEGSRLKPRRP